MRTPQRVTSKGPAGARKSPTVRPAGGSAVCAIGGPRLPTAPTFDALGPATCGSHTLVRTEGPAEAVENVGTMHAVPHSHDVHGGNFGGAGRRLLASVPITPTTPATVDRPGRNATALPPWCHPTADRPGGGCVKLTGAPAGHRPDGRESITGSVTGCVRTGPDAPTACISDRNTALESVTEVAQRCVPIRTPRWWPP